MKASFLPTTTYGVRAVYEAGWPSPPGLFEPELGRRMMEEMFEQAALADEVGFDWISFSEHHYAPLLVPTLCWLLRISVREFIDSCERIF